MPIKNENQINREILKSQIILGAINKSPSAIEGAFNSIIRDNISGMIETKRAEVGANLLQKTS